MDVSFNGLWVGAQGETFIFANPYTVWGEVNGRHLSAYGVRAVDNGGFFGYYEGSKDMLIGGFPPILGGRVRLASPGSDEQIFEQSDLVAHGPSANEGSRGSFIRPHIIPCVPRPEVTSAAGQVQIKTGVTRADGTVTQLHLNWQNAQGVPDFTGPVSFVCKSDRISIDGTYSAKHWSATLSENGERSGREIDGTLTYIDKTYSLHGWRVWTRGGFELVDRTTGDIVGAGWLEWNPTKEFLNKLQGGANDPTDRIELHMVSVDLENGGGANLTRNP